MHNLAVLYLYIGLYEKAIAFLEESIAIKKKHYVNSDQHIEIINTEDVLAYINAFQGNYLYAEKIFEKSYNVTAKVYAENQVNIVKLLADHGNIHRILKNYKRSEELLNNALSEAQKLESGNELLIASITGNLGLLYEQLGDNVKKEYYLYKAKEIFNNTLSANHPYIVKIERLLKTNSAFRKNTNEIGFLARILIA